MAEDLHQLATSVADHLAAGNGAEAETLLGEWLVANATALATADWSAFLSLYADAIAARANPAWQRVADQLRTGEPEGLPLALYDLAYQSISVEVYPVAEILLRYASRLAPDEVRLVTELVSALELQGKFAAAEELLRGSHLLAGNDYLAYLLAFQRLMQRDSEEPRQLMARLASSKMRNAGYYTDRIAGALARAELLRASPESSLRTWHFIHTGAVLLDEGDGDEVAGTYPVMRASYEDLHQGFCRLGRVLAAWELSHEQLFHAYQPADQALGLALADWLEVPARAWQRAPDSGLVTVWRPQGVMPELVDTISLHDPGVLFYSHWISSERELAVTPDITNCIARRCVAPWQRFRDPLTNESFPRDRRPPRELADDILAATPGEAELTDLDDLSSFAERIRATAREHGPWPLRSGGGRRSRQWVVR